MVALAFISGAQSSTNQQQSQSSIRGKLLSNRDESAKYETSPAASTSLLSNINPWLSACDLAQPSTAPDLQVINQFLRSAASRIAGRERKSLKEFLVEKRGENENYVDFELARCSHLSHSFPRQKNRRRRRRRWEERKLINTFQAIT